MQYITDQQTKGLLYFYQLLDLTSQEFIRDVDLWHEYKSLLEEASEFSVSVSSECLYYSTRIKELLLAQSNIGPKRKNYLRRVLKLDRENRIRMWQYTTGVNALISANRAKSFTRLLEDLEADLDQEIAYTQFFVALVDQMFTGFSKRLELWTSLYDDKNLAIEAMTKRKYREQARRYHPDRGVLDGFNLLNLAYNTIKDPEKRLVYNNTKNHQLWMTLYGDEIETNTDSIRLQVLKARKMKHDQHQLMLTYHQPNRVGGVKLLEPEELTKTITSTWETLEYPASDKDSPLPTFHKPGTNQVALKWFAVSGDIEYYSVYGQVDGDLDLLLGNCKNSRCVVTQLRPNLHYSFWITATGTNGTGEPSAKIACSVDGFGIAYDPFSVNQQKLYHQLQLKRIREQKRNQRKRKAMRKKLLHERKVDRELPVLSREKVDLSKRFWKAITNWNFSQIEACLKKDTSLSGPSIVNIPNRSGILPLIHISQSALASDLEEFLAASGDLVDWNMKDTKHHKSALMSLVENPDEEMLQVFLEHGKHKIDPNLQDLAGNTVIHLATLQQDPELLECLINSLKPNVNILNDSYHTALHIAADQGDCACARILIQAGALLDVFEEEPGDCSSPLFVAISQAQTEMIHLLINEITIQPQYSYLFDTVSHLAVVMDNLEILKVLFASGAGVDSQNLDGDTCLHLAYEMQSQEIISYLKNELGANPNVYNQLGMIPKEMVQFAELDDDKPGEQTSINPEPTVAEAKVEPPPPTPEDFRQQLIRKVKVLENLMNINVINQKQFYQRLSELCGTYLKNHQVTLSDAQLSEILGFPYLENKPSVTSVPFTKGNPPKQIASTKPEAQNQNESEEKVIERPFDTSLFSHVPDEIIFRICTYLPVEDLLNFGCVNARTSIVADDNRLWRLLCAQKYPGPFTFYPLYAELDWKLEYSRLFMYENVRKLIK